MKIILVKAPVIGHERLKGKRDLVVPAVFRKIFYKDKLIPIHFDIGFGPIDLIEGIFIKFTILLTQIDHFHVEIAVLRNIPNDVRRITKQIRPPNLAKSVFFILNESQVEYQSHDCPFPNKSWF